MGAPAKANFKVYQGSTFEEVLRLETSKKVYKDITNITKTAPAVVTAVTHGVPNGWRVKVTNVVGMKEINNSEDYLQATVLTADTIELNSINAAGYTAYTSGGIIEYNEPMSLSGATARMQIREKLESTTVIKELTTDTGGGIVVNDTEKTITITISATDTAAFTFGSAVYSLELVQGTKVTQVMSGTLTLVKEVTR